MEWRSGRFAPPGRGAARLLQPDADDYFDCVASNSREDNVAALRLMAKVVKADITPRSGRRSDGLATHGLALLRRNRRPGAAYAGPMSKNTRTPRSWRF